VGVEKRRGGQAGGQLGKQLGRYIVPISDILAQVNPAFITLRPPNWEKRRKQGRKVVMVVCARAAKREKGGRASCHNRLTAIASSLPFAFLMITFRRLPLTRWLLFGTHTHTCTQEARTTSNPSGTHERNYINNSPNSRLLDGMEQVHPTPQRLKQKLVSIEFSFRKK
jgi:hypothetical protein